MSKRTLAVVEKTSDAKLAHEDGVREAAMSAKVSAEHKSKTLGMIKSSESLKTVTRIVLARDSAADTRAR